MKEFLNLEGTKVLVLKSDAHGNKKGDVLYIDHAFTNSEDCYFMSKEKGKYTGGAIFMPSDNNIIYKLIFEENYECY